MKKSTIRHSGFSLVEILVVLSIIIVLAGILLPTITRMNLKRKMERSPARGK